MAYKEVAIGAGEKLTREEFLNRAAGHGAVGKTKKV
jgi:hypothetical protein